MLFFGCNFFAASPIQIDERHKKVHYYCQRAYDIRTQSANKRVDKLCEPLYVLYGSYPNDTSLQLIGIFLIAVRCCMTLNNVLQFVSLRSPFMDSLFRPRSAFICRNRCKVLFFFFKEKKVRDVCVILRSLVAHFEPFYFLFVHSFKFS